MNQKPAKGLLKHADFILIDVVCLQLCYAVTYWLINGWGNPYAIFGNRYLAIVLVFGQLLTILFSNNYNGILRRGLFRELISVLQYTLFILVFSLIFLFVVHETTVVSRLQMSLTLVLFVFIDYIARMLNGKWIRWRRSRRGENGGRSLVLITSGSLVDDAMKRLCGNDTELPQDYFISGIILMDADFESVKGEYHMPIIPLNDDAISRIKSKWVDEVLILQPLDMAMDKELFNDMADMGITVHFTLALLNDEDWPPLQMRKIGSFKVLTSSMNYMTYNQALMKRLLDIIGGLFGCIITGLLCIFVGPAIYIKSPGPIFFKQDRIGLNGKVFKRVNHFFYGIGMS